MNLKETSAVMDILTVAYPDFYARKTDQEKMLAVKLWAEMFAQDDVRLVLAAVKAFIATDTKGFHPKVGQIKASVVELTKPPELEMSELEAWGLVRKAIHGAYMDEWSRKERYGNKVSAVYNFEKLPPLLQQIVGRPEQLAEWNKLPDDELASVVASNFQRSFRAKSAHAKEFLALPADIRQTMERLGNGMTFKALGRGSDG